MGLNVRRRTQNAVAFSNNGKVSEDLSRGMTYRELALTLTATPTVAALDNVAANIQRGDEWALIKRIDIIANGTETIKSFSGPSLRHLQYKWYGQTPRQTAGLGDGATANLPLRSTVILPFWMPNVIRPLDTALQTANLSSLTINVTWGTHTDFNSAATGFTTDPELQVESFEHFGGKGNHSQWRIWELEQEVTASNSKFQIKLPVGGLFADFDIVTTDAGVEQDDIISNIKLMSGSTVFMEGNFKAIRDAVNLRRNRNMAPNGVSAASDFLGWLPFETVSDGFLSEAIDTLGYSELTLEMDVTKGAGTTKVIVIPHQVIPIRGK